MIIIIIAFIDNKREVISDLCVIQEVHYTTLHSRVDMNYVLQNYIYEIQFYKLTTSTIQIHVHRQEQTYKVSCRESLHDTCTNMAYIPKVGRSYL